MNIDYRCIFCVSSFFTAETNRRPSCISSEYHFYSIEKRRRRAILQRRENRLITVEESSHEKKSNIYVYICILIYIYMKKYSCTSNGWDLHDLPLVVRCGRGRKERCADNKSWFLFDIDHRWTVQLIQRARRRWMCCRCVLLLLKSLA